MRNFLLSQLLLCVSFCRIAICQSVEANDIQTIPLEITTGKTTHIVFPYSIKTVDRGNGGILAQTAAGFDNILQVKAAMASFDTTNLTVITGDGTLYSFLASYCQNPSSINIRIGKSKNAGTMSGRKPNEAEIEQALIHASHNDSSNVSIKDQSSQTKLELSGIYICGDILLCKLTLTNNSPVKYDIETLRFSIRDKKRPKRTAIQETYITPFRVLSDTTSVASNAEHTFIYAIPKMTIPDKKLLSIALHEKDGGRHLNLKVRNRHILKSLPLTTN
jgi:conjugative transposon TraN protein